MIKHTVVVDENGVRMHRDVPAARSSTEFDVTKMSKETRDAFKADCIPGTNCYRRWAARLSSGVLDDIIK